MSVIPLKQLSGRLKAVFVCGLNIKSKKEGL